MALSSSNQQEEARQPVKATLVIEGTDYDKVSQYSYDNDLLQVGDQWAVTLPDPKGELVGKIKLGQSAQLFFEDRNIPRTKMLTGIVTTRRATSSNRTGTSVVVGGADLGWHLVNGCAPMWKRLRGVTWQKLLDEAIGQKSWNFQGVKFENHKNTKLKQGREGVAYLQNYTTPSYVPPIEISIGESWADVLIRYAQRENRLLNVSADGYLQLFEPNYKQRAAYQFTADKSDPTRNNILEATLDERVDGIYSETICVGSVVRYVGTDDRTNPHQGQFRGKATYSDAPFYRLLTFADGEVYTNRPVKGQSATPAAKRAEWRARRELFNSWEYVVRVPQHSQWSATEQVPLWYTVDTMAEVDDSILGVKGSYYITRVRFQRTMQGTTTEIHMRKPNLLQATST